MAEKVALSTDAVHVGEPQNLDDYKVPAIHVRPLQ